MSIIYQIYVKSFNKGTINGITEKLNYLKNLNVDIIWLNPIYPHGGIDGGYDITDYKNIDPKFGTLSDFKKLIEKCHQKNIKILMDLVINHTSDKHQWFIDSINKTNGRDDWYIWKDKDELPANWVSLFTDSPWTYCPLRGKYYYHYFYKEQPDLNLDNIDVQNEIKDVISFWLDMGIDGFRLDAISCLFENHGVDNLPNSVSSQLNQDKTFDYLAELKGWIKSKYGENIIMLGETEFFSDGQAVKFFESMDLVMDYEIAYLNRLDAYAFEDAIYRWENLNLQHEHEPLYYFNNHDRPRCRYGEEDPRIAKLMACLLLLQNGTKIIYYGEEIGMHNGKDMHVDDMGRDGCRTPMQWSDDQKDDLFLPLNSDYKERNVNNQESDPDSILNWYRMVTLFSKTLYGLPKFLQVDLDKNVLWMSRYSKIMNREIMIGFNLSDKCVDIPFELSIITRSSLRGDQDFMNPYEVVIGAKN